MQSMACAGALEVSNSASSWFWRGGGGDTFVIESRCVKKSWNRLVQVAAQGAGGRASRGRGDRNCQDRRNSATLSKDYGRERFAREDYGRERFAREDYGSKDSAEAGRGATFRRGRGSGGSYRGRGGYGNNSSSYSGDYSGNRGSSGSGRGYRGNGRDYNSGARSSEYGGNTRGRGRGGGAGRYDELRRLAEKRMHDGAFEMLDEETGEKVIVWGVEDADSWPKPSAEDLKWKPTTVAMAGDVSEEGWYKAMEASMAGPSGAFSVKGVRQGGVYNDEEDDNDDEDEMDDMDYDDDDEDEDGDEFDDELRADLPEEPPFVRTVRPTRLRLFGRDFKQKEVLRSAATEEDRSIRTAASSRDGQESTSNGVPSSVFGVDNTTTAIADDDVAQSWPPAGHLLTKNGPDVAPFGAKTNTDDNSFSDNTSIEEALDEPWPPAGALFSGDDDSSASFPLNQDSSEVETASNGTTSRDSAWKDVERVVVTEQDWKQGGMNPGILDIDEDEDDEYEGARRMANPKPRDGFVPVRSNLLDELRLQTTHKKLSSRSELGAKDENGARSHADFEDASDGVAVVKPRGFRDLKARTNYDPSLAAEFFSTKSFEDVSASEEVIAALRTLQLKKPSAIQAMVFKPVLEGQSCIVADQTGSGKTLAYLAPLVQMLRAEEGKSLTKKLNKMPRILVLVPTSELAVQVLNVCRAFSRGGAPFRSLVLTGGFKWKTQVESLTQGADVVVATPGRFLQHLEKGSLKLDNLKTVVLDEVDILYDDQEFTEVLQTLEQAASRRVQYVHVTATLPVDIHDSLLTRYPDAIPLMGPTLHRTAVGLQEVLVDCSGAEGEEKTPEKALLSKKAVLLQLVDQRPVSKTIIFCNKIETCRDVENALHRHDRSGMKLTVLPYHAALSQEARLESMQRFLESQPSKSLFLVCTDRASRGLDSFDVEHVVLFDYPRDPSEYVRRVGRTARGAGGTGTVFVFALGKQVAMARRIMARNEKGRPVHDIPGSAYET